MSETIALAGRIRAALSEVEGVAGRAILLGEKARRSGDDDYWDGVALNLHGFYTSVERIFEDIARTMETGLPSGPEWHRDLLLQMSAEVPGVRPRVIQPQARRCLDEYRGFRHVVRNVYTFNLRPARLDELVGGLNDYCQMVQRDLGAFAAFLDELAQAVDNNPF